MKKSALFLLYSLLLFLTACAPSDSETEAIVPETTPATVPVTTESSIIVPTEAETAPVITEPRLELTEEEKKMLLKLGMAECGEDGCTTCIALVMRTVLNRVEAGRFGKDIRNVIFAQGQFTPVADGSYYSAEPNAQCLEALEMVICGWDESQGSLFYEWCEGESWHSKNLHLLFQHCDIRFYE